MNIWPLDDLNSCASITSPQNEKRIDRLFAEQESLVVKYNIQQTAENVSNHKSAHSKKVKAGAATCVGMSVTMSETEK